MIDKENKILCCPRVGNSESWIQRDRRLRHVHLYTHNNDIEIHLILRISFVAEIFHVGKNVVKFIYIRIPYIWSSPINSPVHCSFMICSYFVRCIRFETINPTVFVSDSEKCLLCFISFAKSFVFFKCCSP